MSLCFGFVGRNCLGYFGKQTDPSVQYEVCVLARSMPDESEIPPNVICYYGRADNPLLYERIFLENSIDYVIHLAAVSTKEDSDRDLAETYYINERFVDILCDTIIKNEIPIKGVILSSTSLVYEGALKGQMAYEESTVIDAGKIKNTYTRSKFIAELKAKDYARKGVPIIVARFSNVYGKYEAQAKRLIPRVIAMLEAGEVPELYVDKSSGRSECKDYIYSEDLAEAVGMIIKNSEKPDFKYDPENCIYNIGSGVSTSVEEIINMIAALMNQDVKPRCVWKELSLQENYFSVAKIEKEIGFSASTKIMEGLKKTVEWRKKAAKSRSLSEPETEKGRVG